jgi:hypothetical protein
VHKTIDQKSKNVVINFCISILYALSLHPKNQNKEQMKNLAKIAAVTAVVCVAAMPARAQWITHYLLKTINNSAEYVNSQLYDNGTNIGIGTALPGEKFDVVGGNIRTTGSFISLTPTGNSPFGVASSTLVVNLNTDMVDGQHASAFAGASHNHAGMLTGSGVATRLAFWDGSGSLSSNPLLFWDNVDLMLGIGVPAPEARLHLYDGDGEATIRFQELHPGQHGTPTETTWDIGSFDGNFRFNAIGPGNTNTVMKLSWGNTFGTAEVNGVLRATRIQMTLGAGNNFVLSSNSAGMATWKDPALISGWTVNGNNAYKTTGFAAIGTNQNLGGKFNIQTGDLPALIINANLPNNGQAYGLLSKSNSDYFKALAVEHNATEKLVIWGDGRLVVDNTIKAKEIEVEIDVWQDRVFEPDYPLMSLQELECYIKENKHLPEMPTEQEVLTNGISLDEMVVLLLKKVEELTLYVIEMEKR